MRNAIEADLVCLLGIWSLLHLKHLNVFLNYKSVASGGQQNHVSAFQHATLQIILLAIIEVNAQFPLPDEKHLLGVFNLSLDRRMDMGLNGLAAWVLHEAQLL